jgi:hypothetical protein
MAVQIDDRDTRDVHALPSSIVKDSYTMPGGLQQVSSIGQ